MKSILKSLINLQCRNNKLDERLIFEFLNTSIDFNDFVLKYVGKNTLIVKKARNTI